MLDPNGLLHHATKEVARLLFFVPFQSLAPRLRIVHHTRVEGAHRLRQREQQEQSPTARFAVVARGSCCRYCVGTKQLTGYCIGTKQLTQGNRHQRCESLPEVASGGGNSPRCRRPPPGLLLYQQHLFPSCNMLSRKLSACNMRSRHSERVIAATVAKRSRSLGARGTAISAQNLISVQDAIRRGAVAIRRCMTRPIHSAESRRRRMLCCHILAAWAVMSLSKLNCIHPEQIRRAPRLCRGPPRAPSRQNKQRQSLPHQRRPSMIPAPHLRRRRGEAL